MTVKGRARIDPRQSDAPGGNGVLAGAVADRAGGTVGWSLFGTVLGLILLYAATRRINTDEVWAVLQSVNWVWALGVLAATFLFTAIKAWRWGLLLSFIPGVRYSRLHSAVQSGLAANFLLSHIGELIRATLIAKDTRSPVAAVLASIIVERALDFIALLLLLSLLPLVAPELPAFIRVAASVTAAIVVLSITGLYAMAYPPDWLQRGASVAGAWLPVGARAWCAGQIQKSRTGLAAITDARVMGLAVAASILQWVLVVTAIACSVAATGEPVTIATAMITFVLIVIGLTLPNAPMQIGTTQLAFSIGLGVGGIAATSSIAASVVYTLFLIVPIMLAGGWCLVRLGGAVRGPRVRNAVR